MSQLARVQEGLEEAHKASPRSGKWSTPGEVRHFEEIADLTKLRQLVKDGAATEKVVKGVPTQLFKPTRAGSGMYGLGEDDIDKDRGQDDDGKKPRKPRGKHPKKPGRRGKKPGRRDGGKKPGRRGDGKKPGRRGGKPDAKKPPRRRSEPKKPSGPPKGPRRGNAVSNTLGAGIGTLLVGGMGSSMGGGGVAAPRGGSVGYISGPM